MTAWFKEPVRQLRVRQQVVYFLTKARTANAAYMLTFQFKNLNSHGEKWQKTGT